MLATFTVTNLADAVVSFPGSAPGTLRQAVYDANNTPGADVIQFAAGLSGTINLSVVGNSEVGASALLISSQITIQGNASGITIGRNEAGPEMRLIRIATGGNLTLKDIALTGGIARGATGSSPGESGGEAHGGSILNQGVLQVTASTFYGNQAIGGNGAVGGAGGSGRGGAIYNDGGTLTLTNATLSGNSTASGSGASSPSHFGGGIYSRNGTIAVDNSTITNSTSYSGRALYVLAENGTATVEIRSSILGQADVPATFDVNITEDTGGHLVVSGDNNLIRRQNDFEFLRVSQDDPQLGPLASNGGPTMTHAPAADSPVINQGSNPQQMASDQRGTPFARVMGGVADIGAVELQTISTLPAPGDYNGNSIVDAADYVIWRNTFGAEVAPFTGADGDGNGAIQTADYDFWRTRFGATASAAGIGSAIDDYLIDGGSDSMSTAIRATAFAALGELRPSLRTLRQTICIGEAARLRTSQTAKTADLALLSAMGSESAELPGQWFRPTEFASSGFAMADMSFAGGVERICSDAWDDVLANGT